MPKGALVAPFVVLGRGASGSRLVSIPILNLYVDRFTSRGPDSRQAGLNSILKAAI